MKRFTAITLVIVILMSSFALTSCDASNVVVGIFRELIGAVVHKHTPGVMPAIESTCSEHGFTEGSYCVTCGETLVPQKETPLKPHTQVIVPAVESTCVNNGKSEGIYCLICSTVIIEPKSIPLSTHTYDDDNDASCNYCGYLRDVQCAHATFENIPSKESTCTETGLTAGVKCKDCGEIILAQEATPLKEHIASDWIVDQNATLDAEGLKHIECTECKIVLSSSPIAKLVWVEVDSGTFEYATFPSGFWTGNSIYTSMQKEPYTEYETETTKRVVTVQKAGFVYWHWMYPLSGTITAGDRVIYYKYSTYNPYVASWGPYTVFGAFKSTKSYPEAYDSYNDPNQWYKVTDRSSDHQGSLYWYRFEYYTCTYTDYVISSGEN